MRLTTMAGARPTDDVQEQLQVAVKEFLSNSSMHGLKYIGESSRSYVERYYLLFFSISLCRLVLENDLRRTIICTQDFLGVDISVECCCVWLFVLHFVAVVEGESDYRHF